MASQLVYKPLNSLNCRSAPFGAVRALGFSYLLVLRKRPTFLPLPVFICGNFIISPPMSKHLCGIHRVMKLKGNITNRIHIFLFLSPCLLHDKDFGKYSSSVNAGVRSVAPCLNTPFQYLWASTWIQKHIYKMTCFSLSPPVFDYEGLLE